MERTVVRRSRRHMARKKCKADPLKKTPENMNWTTLEPLELPLGASVARTENAGSSKFPEA